VNGDSVALDANQAIAVLNDADDAGTWISQFANVFLPVPVVGELRFGALNSRRSDENLRRIELLISRCTVLDVNLSTTESYARVRLQLKRSGTPIPQNDVWIAAVCIQCGLPLATVDNHFDYIEGLTAIKR